jgi:antitoxin VapB
MTDNRVKEAPQTFKAAAPWQAASGGLIDVRRYSAKVFKSGNSLALRLPAGLGLEAGMEMNLIAEPDGRYTLTRIEPPRKTIDVSGWAGKAPWLKPLPRELREFDERPSTIAARQKAEGKA